ncbi:DUF4124 domain-containing protein [Pseudothauera rhizosphaerae]|uniref:DUF4124 domain-containing protein n=1 Tax=Pseudothauera rhizosphaerae TaxID=2565932 RepID=A0A4S4ARX8_9RHOO|nr:DUF4124 domain-containing protein [Pseudothauera rhizosphaerae]THF61250.1 DUF4124 domain-containing protein [Pseudothauera rhizosphaerae]
MRKLLLSLLTVFAASAHAQVYKCVDAEGRVTYTNDRTSMQGCTVLKQDLPVSSVPVPERTPSPQATPGGFPRVAPDTQRERDGTRREILQTELAKEQEALAEARKALAEEEARDTPEDRNAPKRTTRTITTPDGGKKTVVDVGPATINLAKREARLQPFKDKAELHQRNVEAIQRELQELR